MMMSEKEMAENRRKVIAVEVLVLLLIALAFLMAVRATVRQAVAEPSPSPALEAVAAPVRLELDQPVKRRAEPAPRAERYAGIQVSDAERELLAKVIWLEAGTECGDGQQAVAEVVFNRVLHPSFPGTVADVLREHGQFSAMAALDKATPCEAQYAAIDAALSGANILPTDVVFFSTTGENDRVWGKIGGHVFCREYVW